MPKDSTMTNASGASITTHFSGVPKMAAIMAGLDDTSAATRPVRIRPAPM